MELPVLPIDAPIDEPEGTTAPGIAVIAVERRKLGRI